MTTSTSGESQNWEAIRPWTNRISIQVKELASVSATFILSSATAATAEDGELAALHGDQSVPQVSHKSIGERLAQGFTVKVNNGSWDNYVYHVDEDGSEAVIILYGLRPGRQYEVEIALHQDENALRKDFATLNTEAESPKQAAPEQEQDNEEVVNDLPELSPELVPSRELTPPVTPESSPPSHRITIEEKAAHLQLTKSTYELQLKELDSQLKTERKESQRAENATRAEIEALKKATEKQTATDQRAKQRVLALQEAVKQTISATADIEAQAQAIQADLPRVKQEEAVVEGEHAKVREEANQKDVEVDQALRADKKRISELQSEMNGFSNKIEKLTTKKEKLTTETLPDLEQQLSAVRREIEEMEREKEQYSLSSFAEDAMHSPLAAFRGPIRPAQTGMRPLGPRRSLGPFTVAHQPPPPPPPPQFSQINAAAPPFFPNRQPGLIHRGPLQQASRSMNEFRPFDPALPQLDSSSAGMAFGTYPQVPRRTSMDGQ